GPRLALVLRRRRCGRGIASAEGGGVCGRVDRRIQALPTKKRTDARRQPGETMGSRIVAEDGFVRLVPKAEASNDVARSLLSVAYFILPQYAFNEPTKITDLCLNTPTTAGPYFYIMAALMQKVEPDTEDAKRFHWHHGQLDDSREYFALEYPEPPPVDMSDV